MIKLLFNRFSLAVKITEVCGVLLMIFAMVRCYSISASAACYVFIGLIFVLYAFIRFCTTRRWYKGSHPYSGIEVQFKKALVPTGYTMSICALWYLLSPSIIPLIIAAAFLIVIAHVNIILLYFHLRDKDKTMVNYYSSGRFMKSNAASNPSTSLPPLKRRRAGRASASNMGKA
ncbi:MAG: hypothetical protein ABH871_07015 [Pseudomonadota bacterium]